MLDFFRLLLLAHHLDLLDKHAFHAREHRRKDVRAAVEAVWLDLRDLDDFIHQDIDDGLVLFQAILVNDALDGTDILDETALDKVEVILRQRHQNHLPFLQQVRQLRISRNRHLPA